ncbi:MAG: MFS transporter [Candidatus Caldarchaeum sp.]
MVNRDKPLLWTAIFSSMFSAQMILPVIGLYAAVELGADALTVGTIYGTSALTAFVLRIPAAMLSHRIGTRRIMVFGMAASSAGSVLYGFAAEPLQMIVGSLLRGLGSAFFFPAALTSLYEEAGNGEGDPKSLGYMLTGPALGMALGPVFGAASLSLLGYRPTFSTAAAISLVGLATISATKIHMPNERAPSFKSLLEKRFTSLLASRFLVNYVTGTIAAFLPLMAKLLLGYDEPVVLLLFTTAAFTNLFSRVFMGTAAKKLGAQNYVALGSLTVSLSSLMFALGHDFSVWLGALVYGLGMGIFVLGSVYMTGLLVPPAMRTMGFALITLMIDMGNSVGNFVSGVLLSLGGFAEVFAVAAVVGAAGLFVDLISRRWPLPYEKRSQSSAE